MARPWSTALLALLLLPLVLAAGAPAEPGSLPGGCAGGCPGTICCMHCSGDGGTEGPVFDCQSLFACVERGGQAKPPRTSEFSRPPARPWRASAAPTALAEHGPDQVHLIGGSPDEAAVVFLTRKPGASAVDLRNTAEPWQISRVSGRPYTYSFFNEPWGWPGFDGGKPEPGSGLRECKPENGEAYTLSKCMYTSGVVHTVHLTGLRPGTRYEYRPAGSDRWRPFRTPPAVGQPVTFGVTADVGQTEDSLYTMRHLKSMLSDDLMDVLLLPGDLSYADGFGPAWDTWGRLSEFLLETVPTAYGVGNHEYAAGFENFAHFLPRYGWPHSLRSGSTSPLWFSFEAGLAHVIMLCSYCDYSADSLQVSWLKGDLEAVDRRRTPWVIALWHTPWYVSSLMHGASESADMRAAMEDVIYAHKVDVVLSGHLHAYERTLPVYQGKERCDAPVFITIGDGGNHEGPACPWMKDQPEWSAKREFSFGHGVLAVENTTHAHWAWHRNQDGRAVFADGLWLQRASHRCTSPLHGRAGGQGDIVT